MVKEKFNFLRQAGRIHFFSIDQQNFVYCRETNQTYQIGNDIYEFIKTEGESSSRVVDTTLNLYYQIKSDVKPNVALYTLFIVNPYKLDLYAEYINRKSTTFSLSEIIFDESSNNLDEGIFLQITSQLHNFRNELVLIKEKKVSSLLPSEGNGSSKPLIKYVLDIDIDIDKQLQISSLDNVADRFMLEYTQDREAELLKLVQNSNAIISFYIRSSGETSSFLSFLLNILNTESKISDRIYNLYTIGNFLVANAYVSRTIEVYDNGTFHTKHSNVCDKCWAKNACWSTKSFKLFDINLSEVEQHVMQCDSIRTLIENIILRLRRIENNRKKGKKTVYDFDGIEIKLIN